MDIISIRLFVRAAERLNIGAAGRDLGLAPAVASSRLAKLEHQLGVELLHRSTRKVSISIEGQEFLPFAQDIVTQHDAAMAALGQGNAQITGTIRFAAPSTFSQLHIAPLLPKLLADHPELTLDLRLSDAPFDLLEGSFDLALRHAALANSSLKARKLAEVEHILCAAPSYLKGRAPIRTPHDLAEHDFIRFRQYHETLTFEQDGKRVTISTSQLRSRVVIDDGASQRLVTVAGLGISLHANWSVQRELQDGSLVQILPDYKVIDDNALWLVYPKSNVLTAKVRVLIDFLVSRIGHAQPWIEKGKR